MSVPLVIQHVTCVHHIILPSVTCPALQYFSTLSHKRYDFRGWEELLAVKCVCVDFIGDFCLKLFLF